MNTETDLIKVNNIEIATIRKDIKNLHLGVYPPNGRVRIAAPLKISDEAIRLFAISKIHWIKKQQSVFHDQERQTKREYTSGESHYFFGKRYRLNVISTETHPKIEIKRKAYIDLYIKPNTILKKREKLFEDYYRAELKKQVPIFLKKWQNKVGVNVDDVKIKKMKTKWGTYNHKDNRIWLNLELAKKSLNCIEYILLHEMIHFLEKNHTERFKELMDSFMPKWKLYKDELNNSILGYADWNY